MLVGGDHTNGDRAFRGGYHRIVSLIRGGIDVEVHASYDAATNNISISPERGRAFEACLKHFSDVFRKGNFKYAIPEGTIRSDERMRQFAAFIFWTAWAASTNRPNDTMTYTNNWPHEPLIGNRPTGDSVMWTGVSIIMLLAGICTHRGSKLKSLRNNCQRKICWEAGAPPHRNS